MRAIIDSKEIFAETRKLMSEQNIPIEEETETIMETLEHDGKTAMLIAISGELVGVIAVADTVKETSKEAVARMHKLGLEVIMLTGDNERDRKSTRLNSSHVAISYAVFCLKKKK